MLRSRSCRKEQAGLRERIKELAGERRRFGYRRLHALLRREGCPSTIGKLRGAFARSFIA